MIIMRRTVSLAGFALAFVAVFFICQVHAQSAATGIPYFQQHVHYSLTATFIDDRDSPSIDGSGTLEYQNNSPDTLHELYFHLYWNLFCQGSYGEKASERSRRPQYGHRGVEIKSLKIGSANARYEIDNTIMRVFLSEPLLPGAKIDVNYDWNSVIPNYGVRSTWGWHDGAARNFSTAQWYPQVCVYDNHGWHPDQYIGLGEFYTDYGTFDVTLNLPTRFTTAVSTGWLTNAADVLPDSVRAHLDFAKAHPDSIVHIADFSNFHYEPISKDEPMRAWKFHADSVRDFAWAADEAYIWDAVYDNGILHHAVYWNSTRDFWSKEGAKVVLVTIQTNSRFAGQYMYPNAFLCVTYEGGMEYPGIVFVGPSESGSPDHRPYNTMMHELGHEWYPMMMGSNETDYGYMDEGFNTFITTFVQEKYFGRWNNSYSPGLGFNDDERTSNYRSSIVQQLLGNQEPSVEKADMYLNYRSYAVATYPHTSSVFFMLRYTMGDRAFDDFMHLYYERWRFKHPYPDDLLNAAEDIERREGDTNRVRARGDLRWFFDEWFQKTWKLDYAIGCFHVSDNTATVTIERKERAVMPIDLVFTFDDGTTEQKWIPVDDWLRTVAIERTYSYTFSKHPVHVEINPSRELLDINRLNNTSSWIPPLDVSLVPKIFGDIKPIDEYAIRSAPFVAPLDGIFSNSWSLGWTLLGSYLNQSDRLALGLRTLPLEGSTSIEGVLQYHNVLDGFSPWMDIDISAMGTSNIEMFGLNLSQIVYSAVNLTPRHIFNVGYNLSGDLWARPLIDTEITIQTIPGNGMPVLPSQDLASVGSPVPLNRVFGGYTFHDESEMNEFSFAGQVEAGVGDPRTNYSKLAGMIDDRLNIGNDWNAFIRFFGGSMQPINGLLPGQTLFQLASSDDVDHFSDLYGSNFGMGVRDKIRNAVESGPLVRGYLQDENMEGRVALSGTFEIGNHSLFPFTFLREIPFAGQLFDMFGLTFFADAGLVTDAFCTCQLKDDLRSDAGVGLRFFGVNRFIDRSLGLDLDRMDAQLDFPLYLDKPVSGEPKFDLRVVGMVRQNF